MKGGNDVRFDFYRASLLDGTDPEQVINHLALQNPLGDIAEGRPRMGYESCISLRLADGERFADVLYGGSNGTLIETSGEVSPVVVGHIRSAFPVHACPRADVCEDIVTDDRGLFELFHPQLQAIVARHGRVQAVTIRADQSDEGASYRIGSRTSETFIRVYQKPEQLVSTRQGDESLRVFFGRWVRAEVEAKPQKENRFRAATFKEEEFWGLSRIARQVSEAMFAIELAKTGVIDYKQVTARERSRRHLVKQFGSVMDVWAGELGTWSEMAIVMRDMHRENLRQKSRQR